MKKNLSIASLVLLLLCVLGFTYQSKPATWEYKQTCKFSDADKLGADGWEMVSAASSGEVVTCFYFKRAK
jgi:hypothetical protein